MNGLRPLKSYSINQSIEKKLT